MIGCGQHHLLSDPVLPCSCVLLSRLSVHFYEASFALPKHDSVAIDYYDVSIVFPNEQAIKQRKNNRSDAIERAKAPKSIVSQSSNHRLNSLQSSLTHLLFLASSPISNN